MLLGLVTVLVRTAGLVFVRRGGMLVLGRPVLGMAAAAALL